MTKPLIRSHWREGGLTFTCVWKWKPHPRREDTVGLWWLECTVEILACFQLWSRKQKGRLGVSPSSSLVSVRPTQPLCGPQFIFLISPSQTCLKMCVTNALNPVKLTVKTSRQGGCIVWLSWSEYSNQGVHSYPFLYSFVTLAAIFLCALFSGLGSGHWRKTESLSLFIGASKKKLDFYCINI